MVLAGLLCWSAGQAAEPTSQGKGTTQESESWLARWFVMPKKPSAAGVKPDRDKKAAPKRETPPASDTSEALPPRPRTEIDEAADLQEREMQHLIRRQMVCQKLMDIALRAGDQQLLRQAEQLDQRAWQVYLQRTAQFSGGPPLFDSDEKTLEKHLGPTNTAVRPTRMDARAGNGRSTSQSQPEEELE
jgi:hypothetical protein